MGDQVSLGARVRGPPGQDTKQLYEKLHKSTFETEPLPSTSVTTNKDKPEAGSLWADAAPPSNF